jgi:membrane protease YdiL (CAAX protease family)
MLDWALLLAALAVAGWGLVTGRSLPARIAAPAGRTSRPHMIRGWALGTAVTYGGGGIVALALLGRVDALRTMPVELRTIAWSLGLPGAATPAMLAWLAGCLVVGVSLGAGIVAARHRLGRRPFGRVYHSPAAARGRGERAPAALLALSAGVSEELFFRLTIPLLCASAFGSGTFGMALSLAVFTALHRHQGWFGMAAVALVGAWLTYLYLLTGALWLVMLLHILIDLHALVLRPRLPPSS